MSTHRTVFDTPLTFGEARTWIATALMSSRGGVLRETDRHAEGLKDVVERHPRLAGNGGRMRDEG